MSTAGGKDLGRLVRLKALKPCQLPAHADLATLQPDTASLPTLEHFITDIINEASAFMTDYLPQKFSIREKAKTSPPAKATVQLLAHELSPQQLGSNDSIGEPWFARTSLHENKKEQGTADWEEFEAGILDDHSKHEMEYTPDVFDAHKVLSWDSQLAERQNKIGSWVKVCLSIYEMAHHIPPPLENRVFSVLVLTVRSAGPDDPTFIVVQIPVDITDVPQAMYANGRNKQEGDTAQKKKAVTLGQYVSIERCTMVETINVKWQMATASNAKGNLPMWAQKMGVPGAVIKDVGLFIDWTGKRRKASA